MNTAILFDTMSIQNYVFGSNKLKDNLGASFIVEHIYDEFEKFIETGELDIGYIGGGNALLFTSSVDKAKSIIKEFTTQLLQTYPGVSIAVAINDNFGAKDPSYQEKLKKLFKDLAMNKGQFLPINTIPTHGITDVCRYSSLSVEKIVTYRDNRKESYDYISSVTASKRSIEDDVKKEEEIILASAGITGYSFPYELDKLGQDKGSDSHIAIVHIDGNGFGEEFRNLNDVGETEALSKKVKNAVKASFVYSLQEYIRVHESLEGIIVKNFDDKKQELLPIRPIILGGDDVTFICNGQLGIWFAECFMEKFKSHSIDEKQLKPFSSCTGIAIVKSKYPFYRAYQLAEELCNNAKKARKDNGASGNWIDFHLAYGGLGNTLEEIRNLQYRTINNKPIYSRPYSIEDNGVTISFDNIKKYTDLLQQSLPNSKIKDLRAILTQDQASQEVFIEHLMHQHEDFQKNFCKNVTSKQILENYPFFDMIELLELYPTNLLNVNQHATRDI